MGEEYIRRIMVLGQVPSLGPVILFDDMEGVFKWLGSGSGTETVEKSTTVAYNESASLHLKCQTTNPAEDEFVQATRIFFQRPGKRYSVECLWYVPQLLYSKYISFRFGVEDGVYAHTVGLRFVTASLKWQYINSAGSWVDVPGGSHGLGSDGWHRTAFELDESAVKYIKLISDSNEIDMSTLSYQRSAHVGEVNVLLAVSLENSGANAAEGWFDDVLVLEI